MVLIWPPALTCVFFFIVVPFVLGFAFARYAPS